VTVKSIVVITLPQPVTREDVQQAQDAARAGLPDRAVMVVSEGVTVAETMPDLCGMVSPDLGGLGDQDICRRPGSHKGAHVSRPWDPDSMWWTDADSLTAAPPA
jgi:hypothetical protein